MRQNTRICGRGGGGGTPPGGGAMGRQAADVSDDGRIGENAELQVCKQCGGRQAIR